ncbi:MAG: deoxyribonuclease IV, partial [Blautia obeum]|nr:deoxyribonuclease IV [Blautia obeum]
LAQENHFGKIVAHAPYTLNACAAKEELRTFARETFADDLRRMEYTPGNYYNFHPGSHVGQGSEIGIQKIAEILNDVLTEEQTTTVLLETMSGKGTEVGRNFEELRKILNLVEKKSKMGICLDTCHVWDGGYDIVHDLDGVLNDFDHIIGLERLKAIHLNDSLNDCGSHKDRHARIGEGKIGMEALVRIIKHPALREIPFILETPNDDSGWTEEIHVLKEAFYK